MRFVHVHPSLVVPRVPRRAVAVAVATGTLAFGAGVADAHTQVASTSPSAGRTASTGTRSVSVTFSGQIRSGTVTVTGSGRTVSKGRGGQDPRDVRSIKVGLRSGLKPGRYVARWTAVAADGHRQSGRFSFRLKKKR